MLMPFGKYKGQKLDVVPDAYLLWLTANIPLREPLLSAVVEEISARELELPPLPAAPARSSRLPKPPLKDKEDGAWTMGGDPQEIIAGDFPITSRQ